MPTPPRPSAHRRLRPAVLRAALLAAVAVVLLLAR